MQDDPRLDYLIRRVGNAGRKYQQAEAIADMLDTKQASSIWRDAKHDMEFMLRDLREYEDQLNLADMETEAARAEAAEVRVALLEELLREVAASGVEHDDPRIPYLTVQVDRETMDAIKALTGKEARP